MTHNQSMLTAHKSTQFQLTDIFLCTQHCVLVDNSCKYVTGFQHIYCDHKQHKFHLIYFQIHAVLCQADLWWWNYRIPYWPSSSQALIFAYLQVKLVWKAGEGPFHQDMPTLYHEQFYILYMSCMLLIQTWIVLQQHTKNTCRIFLFLWIKCINMTIIRAKTLSYICKWYVVTKRQHSNCD